MITQNYLDQMTSSAQKTNLEHTDSIISKRLRKPTLRSCKYKPEAYAKSMGKFALYSQKCSISTLLMGKFYFDNISSQNFKWSHPQRFSTTNLHGVFSCGFILDEIEISNYINGRKVTELKMLKRPIHHNYSDEVNLITSQFLDLVHPASLRNGPALWTFKVLDLEDPILIELRNLVDVYRYQLTELTYLFHDARFQERTEVKPNFISDEDLDFIVDVFQIWMKYSNQ